MSFAKRHLVPAFVLVASATVAQQSTAATVYDSIRNPLPGNVVSLGYQATSTAEFGDHIQFTGTDRTLSQVEVTMSNWAKFSEYPTMDASGYTHPITLKLYAVDNSGPTAAVGAVLTSQTIIASVPWRPEPFGFNGIAFNISFDFTSTPIELPEEVIFGVSYNTETHGYAPLNAAGPYNSLNVGLSPEATVGTDVNTDSVFWNTTYAPFYTDGGTGGVGTFRQDTGWSTLVPAARVTAVPEPSSLTLIGVGALALLRRRRLAQAI